MRSAALLDTGRRKESLMNTQFTTPADLAARFSLKKQIANGVTEWSGANPSGNGATEDGFVLNEDGTAYDRKIKRRYTSREVAQLFGVRPDQYEPEAQYRARNGNNKPNGKATPAEAPQPIKSPEARGITPQTLRFFGVSRIQGEKWDGWKYPTHHADGSEGRTRFKNAQGKPKYQWWKGGDGREPDAYNTQNIPDAAPEVWGVGGEPDVWAMHQNGFLAVAPFGETQGAARLVSALVERRAGCFHIALDNDRAGREGAAALAEECERQGLPFTVGQFQGADGHDVCDEHTRTGCDRERFRAAILALPEVDRATVASWKAAPSSESRDAEQPTKEAPDAKSKQLSPDEIRAAFKKTASEVAAPHSLADVKATFRRWLYLPDESLIEVTLAATVANLVDGDPAWLMIVAGSSSGKTEAVNPLAALPFTHLVGTLTEAAFLSGSSKRDQTADSTGGLLREVGNFGVLILKDFTSILSIHHDKRMAILAALREIYDGSWSKRGGNDGGKNLTWSGKVGVIACCTDAIESATAVTNSMGERFMRYRWQHSDADQKQIARMAMRRGGGDAQMRAEMREAVCGFFGQLDIPANPASIDEATEDKLIALATFTARGRSVVDRAATGGRDIELIHDSEVPARFGVMIRRMYSALQILGIEEKRIWRILEKIALDSIPKLRGEIIQHFRQELQNGKCELLAGSVAKAVKSSPTATRRALEELRAHDVFAFTERQTERGPTHFWAFSDFGLELLKCGFSTLPEKSYGTHPPIVNGSKENINFLDTVPDDFSGRVDFADEQPNGYGHD
jgi:hypothetical protein